MRQEVVLTVALGNISGVDEDGGPTLVFPQSPLLKHLGLFQKAAKLQEVSTKPVYIPKIDLDHDLIKGVYQGALDLKSELKLSLKQLQEKKAEEPCNSGNHSGPTLMSPSVP